MVPVTGLEPVRYISSMGFLGLSASAALAKFTGNPASPRCLPIPPHRHLKQDSLLRWKLLLRDRHNFQYFLFIYFIKSSEWLLLESLTEWEFDPVKGWRGRWDSNSLTTVLETAALPIRYSPIWKFFKFPRHFSNWALVLRANQEKFCCFVSFS